ncbi:methylenetetrahydrofolate reductase C-terminal domain-containing protein [Ramlibacter sp.]|uniref:methylenetetrahydrofolate reductase C-terminal domain-containing protein n=1 Tax=Ramlibacter sp. TaxID=1917967 RepID=UPI002D3C7670|nr:methylenetetrahydrofolate reductase C-terminal domain-containing protein [Ramlibacter sp.]HYD74508.1 methylenetetrahydrofolate reductase C-terminal domain-containing protein [Ramlibacter sp.]
MKRLRHWSVRHARGLARLYRWLAGLAPRFAPLARAIGVQRLARWLVPLERGAKGLLFDCQMCGDCVLSVTGMACPTHCAKQMRNGPCGGVRTDGGCEVRPEMRCVWLEATDGDNRIQPGHTATWTRRVATLDHRRRGQSAWIQVIAGRPAAPAPAPATATDANPASGPLEAAWREGRFLVTVEIAPPDSPDPAALLQRAQRFRGLADAINITDGAGANCHMSSVAAASVLAGAGFTPVCQVGCRDRNRIALQGDVLGAAALGVRNVLCLTGDDVSRGDHPQAKPVFDLDAVNLLAILRGMRDRAEYASGRKLEQAPRLFLGATANPFVPPYAERVANLERKIDAGAQFIQTQFCFDLAMLEDFMRAVRARGLHRRAAILVGVGTLSSAKALRWMADNVPGVHVPAAVTDRIAAAADPQAEGRRICVETIHALRRIEGVAGVHLMGHRNEEQLARIIVEAGLRPAPAPLTSHPILETTP